MTLPSPSDLSTPSTGQTLSSQHAPPARLEFESITHSYPDGTERKRVLDDISMTVAPGELVSLTGASGSGKSTLLLIAAGLEAPDQGCVRVDGNDLTAAKNTVKAALRRTRVGYVDQHLNLLSALTAAENVALPLELDGISHRRARAVAVDTLDLVGLAGSAAEFPDQLSGGEQQRVAIARALVGDRHLLIADEPTGALDSLTGEQVMRLIRRLCDTTGASALVATHNPSHAAWADRVVHLVDGRITDETHSDNAL